MEFPYKAIFSFSRSTAAPGDSAASSFGHTTPINNVTSLFQLFDNAQVSKPLPVPHVPRLEAEHHDVSSGSSRDSGSGHNTELQPITSIDSFHHQQLPISNSHPMVTRSKTGSLRPRVFLSECQFPSSFISEVEPKSVKAAMSDSRGKSSNVQWNKHPKKVLEVNRSSFNKPFEESATKKCLDSVGKVHKMGKQQWKLVDNHQASMDDELEDSEVLKALHQDMLNSGTIDKVTGEGSMYGVCDNVLDNCIEQVDVPGASNFDEVASKLKEAMEVAME
ncbi:hypothetical protein LWI29_003530 [Acer saccharum]|uniref:Uncharacterized protein n=1 Tax=Acer saccharum TaxID=4024 RepID=A0AA39RUR5_ACESA|nr:hypothetical protein LWI29_003530 [Acer saccharum]